MELRGQTYSFNAHHPIGSSGSLIVTFFVQYVGGTPKKPIIDLERYFLYVCVKWGHKLTISYTNMINPHL